MPDTEANQQAYPQPGSQQPGLGFPVAGLWSCSRWPVARVTVVGSRPQSSETMLFHGLHAHLQRDDVVLADRFYCSYWEVALLRGRGIDDAVASTAACIRTHMGREDQVVYWTKPKRPAWMDEATSAGLPAMDVRSCGCACRSGLPHIVVLVAKVARIQDAKYPKETWRGSTGHGRAPDAAARSSRPCRWTCSSRDACNGGKRRSGGICSSTRSAPCSHGPSGLGLGLVPRQVSLQGTRQTLAAFHSLCRADALDRTRACRIVLRCDRQSPRGHPAGPLRAARVQATPETLSS